MVSIKTMESKTFYNKVAEKYSTISSKRKAYNYAVDNYIKSHKYFGKFKNVLDVGSGSGERIAKLFPISTTITALEESNEMCKLIRKNKKIKYVIESDLKRLKLNDFEDKFDLITMQWNVLGHVQDPIPLVKLCFEILNHGGTLIFDVNNPLNLRHYGIRQFLLNWLFFSVYPRRQRRIFNLELDNLSTPVNFSPASFYTKLLSEAGFIDTKITYLDYDTGSYARSTSGQILIEASKTLS